jgi:hypothetical protein
LDVIGGGELFMRSLGGLVLALALGGCLMGMSEEERAAKKAELAAKDDATCRSYGAKQGTDIYVQCRIAQQKSRDDADNAVAASPTVVVINNPVPTSDAPKLQPMVIPGPRCTSRGC